MGAYPGAAIDLQPQANGDILDVISGVVANNTRIGRKYGVDPATGLLRAFEGYAVNQLLYSDLSTDSNADGLADGFTNGGGANSTLTMESDGEGGTCQRVRYTAPAGTSNYSTNLLMQTSQAGFAAGDTAVESCWVKGSATGLGVYLRPGAMDAAGNLLASGALVSIPTDGQWHRVSALYANLPANTAKVRFNVYLSQVDTGDTCDLYVKKAMVEKVATGETLPTSYVSSGATVGVRNGKLAAEKYTGGGGWWAMPEEQRINYLNNSSFEIDTNSDGIPDGWGTAINGTPTLVTSLAATNAVHGSKAVRLQVTGSAAGQSCSLSTTTATATFAPNDIGTFSVWLGGTKTAGASVRIQVKARDAAGAQLNFTEYVVPLTATMKRYTVASPASPANTDKFMVFIYVTVGNGDTVDLYCDAAQLEKGAGATSYIDNAFTSVSLGYAVRNADFPTFPAGALSPNALTIASVSEVPAGNSASVYWSASSNDIIALNFGASPLRAYSDSTANNVRAYDYYSTVAGVVATVVGRFSGGQVLKAWVNGNSGAGGSVYVAPSAGNLGATIYIGNRRINSWMNAHLHRVVVFNSALSDAEVSAMSDTIAAGVLPKRTRPLAPIGV